MFIARELRSASFDPPFHATTHPVTNLVGSWRKQKCMMTIFIHVGKILMAVSWFRIHVFDLVMT